MNENTSTTEKCCGNPFWAIALVTISLIIVLGSNLMAVREQKVILSQALERQQPAVEQSRQVAARFQKMMMELLQLSQADADAKAIAAKYGIAFTPAAAPAAPAK